MILVNRRLALSPLFSAIALITHASLPLLALGVQDALAGKPGALLSPATAYEMLRPVRHDDYALGFAIGGNGANRIFGTLW